METIRYDIAAAVRATARLEALDLTNKHDRAILVVTKEMARSHPVKLAAFDAPKFG